MSGFDEVVLVSAEGADDWETTLLRGALWFYGVASRGTPREGAASAQADAHRVVLVPGAGIPRQDAKTPCVLAGRAVTRDCLRGSLVPRPDDVVIRGEPYALVTALARDRDLFQRSRGQVVVGPLLDARCYRTHPATCSGGMGAIMTSIGCEKRCRYCPYGATQGRIYGPAGQRRSRPAADLAEELSSFVQRGVDVFTFLADQVLSSDPERNDELKGLVRMWLSTETRRPEVVFTVSPGDLLANRELVGTLAEAFRIRPRLSIDSFDDDALASFGVGFDPATAQASVRTLAALRLPLRLNYIFLRPGMSMPSLRRELDRMGALGEALSYLSPEERFAITCDLFLRELRSLDGAPITEEAGADQAATRPWEPAVLRTVEAILDEVGRQATALHEGSAADPLRAVLDAAAAAAGAPSRVIG